MSFESRSPNSPAKPKRTGAAGATRAAPPKPNGMVMQQIQQQQQQQLQSSSSPTQSRSLVASWKAWMTQAGIDSSSVDSYAQLFAENEIELSQGTDLSDEFLLRLGIKKGGHRLRILNNATNASKSVMKDLVEIREKLEDQHNRIGRIEREMFNGVPSRGAASSGGGVANAAPSSTSFVSNSPSAVSNENTFEGIRFTPKTVSVLNMLLEDHHVTIALMDKAINEAEQLASSLVTLFAARNETTRLLISSIDHEIFHSASVRTLFRQNNVHSRVLSAHAKMVGHYYIKQGLGAPIMMVIADGTPSPKANNNTATASSSSSKKKDKEKDKEKEKEVRAIALAQFGIYEVDPNRLMPDNDSMKIDKDVEAVLKVNQENLMSLVRQFVECIQLSVDIVPTSFREVCNRLQTKVAEKFGTEMSLIAAVGSFMFLRFICPAIIDPVGYGVVQVQPPPQVQRTLLLVAKTLQNLANGTKFNEPYMQFMNSLLSECTPAVQLFCEQVATLPTIHARDHSRLIPITKPLLESSCNNIFKITTSHADKISSALVSGNHPQSNRNFLALSL